MKPRFVLALSCPDRPGIVHRVSGFLVRQGANILEAAQFDDVGTNRFFMRVKCEMSDVVVAALALPERFAVVATELARAVKWHAEHRRS